MFWLQEDVQPAVDMTAKIFGQTNQYDINADMIGICIITKEFGILWSGDLSVNSPSALQEKVNILSDTLNKRVFITKNHSFDFDMALVTSTNKLKREPAIVY
jgi:hypothetical protein